METKVPERFERSVQIHLASCLLRNGFGSSQMMLIAGAPGTGKTFNLQQVLAKLRVETFYFSADQVESHQANKPIETLDARLSAVRRLVSQGGLAALVMDDVDLLLGKYAGVQYTHNLQHLNQKLMEIATGQSHLGPCPIFMCANDPDLLHAPLIRLGRARVFDWRPTTDELCLIVHNLFPSLTTIECRQLVDRFSDATPAFFARLRQSLADEYLNARLTAGVPGDFWREAKAVASGAAKPPTLLAALSDLHELGDRILVEREVLASNASDRGV